MSQNHHLDTEPNNDVSENLIETWKRALAGLVESAPNDTIKNCLRIYNPEIPTRDNIKALKLCRKLPIIETLNFLMKPSSSLSDKVTKDDAIHLLCLKIKNFFPDICQICKESYSFNLNDSPLISCGACGQEVHRLCYLDLFKSMNLVNENEEVRHLIYKIPGFYYLCPPCQDETIKFPHIPNNQTETLSSEQSSTSESASQITEATESIEKDINKTQNTPRRILPQTPFTPNVLIGQQTNDTSEGIGRTENTTNKANDSDDIPVCNFYKKGKCKHGIKGKNCRFKHPKMCTKLLKHGNKSPKGCSAGTKCTMFHPRMCSSSIRKGECFNLDCTFTHVKGTNRNPSNNQVNQNHQTQDFLKILDNFRTEMITMISNNLTVRKVQQPIQTSQQIHQHSLLQRFQDHPLSRNNHH